MKEGRTLTELAAEIQRRAAARKDYIVGTNALGMQADDNGDGPRLVFTNGERAELPINELAHRQIGEYIGIPAKYYDRMLGHAPQLLAENANHWLPERSEKRMVRTLDGRVRAFLSDRYQRIDNHEVAEVVLPALLNAAKLEIVSCEVTEKRLYIKALDKSIVAEVKGSKRVGDLVEAGVMITNSEVGLGAVAVVPFLYFLACQNGAVINKAGMRAAHVGTRHDVDDDIAVLLADDTRRVLDHGVLLKVRDTVGVLLNPEHHQARVDKMSLQIGERLGNNPVLSIELLANDFRLTDGEQRGVLQHLIEGADLSRYGLMNAVTSTAAEVESYDRATELEMVGGQILDMPTYNWQRIARGV